MQTSFVGSRAAFRPAQQLRTAARKQLLVQASVQAAPVALPVKKLDGADAGSDSIALRVADDGTANGLVHR